jgi:hypothetical protein
MTDSLFTSNLVGQEPWARRGDNDARLRSLEVSRATDETALAALPRGVVGTASRTTSFNLTGSNVDIPSLTVTVTTVAGRRYRVTLTVPVVAFVDSQAHIYLLADGTIVATDTVDCTASFSDSTRNLTVVYFTAPSAASHTYKAQGDYAVGSGSPTAAAVSATATIPATIIVEDIGT